MTTETIVGIMLTITIPTFFIAMIALLIYELIKGDHNK